MTVIAILACHDRRDVTRRCLESARASARNAGSRVRFVVFDDGSHDGTPELLATFADVTVIRGDGTAYWAKGMSEAERIALGKADDDDVILWLNDDVDLAGDAVGRLVDAIRSQPDAVWVGAVVEPADGRLTYSGLRRSGPHPLGFARVEPTASPQLVDTFNGNVVGLTAERARGLGGIDGGFSHAFADIDYGLRARARGVPVMLMAGSVGTCPRNPPPARRSVLEEWRDYTDVKGGGNYASLRRVLRPRHPVTWPAPIATSYVLWWARRLPRRGPRKEARP